LIEEDTMAMNVGPGGGSHEPDVMIDINTTPLIDVMLVLLVMLIITIPIQLHAVNLNMPIGNPPPPIEQPQVITIDVDFDGTIFWNGEIVPDKAVLEARLIDAAARPVQPEVHLRPNKLAEYKDVAAVMAAAQRLGVTKLGLVGNEQFVR
jgi:biopolymer transport protein ExbD